MFVTDGVPIDGVTSQHTTIFIQRQCFMLAFSMMEVESLYVGEARSQWKGNEPQVMIERERENDEQDNGTGCCGPDIRSSRFRMWATFRQNVRLVHTRRPTSQLRGAKSEDADGPLASLRPRDNEEEKKTDRYLPLLQSTSSSCGSPSSVPFYLTLQSCISVH